MVLIAFSEGSSFSPCFLCLCMCSSLFSFFLFTAPLFFYFDTFVLYFCNQWHVFVVYSSFDSFLFVSDGFLVKSLCTTATCQYILMVLLVLILSRWFSHSRKRVSCIHVVTWNWEKKNKWKWNVWIWKMKFKYIEGFLI